MIIESSDRINRLVVLIFFLLFNIVVLQAQTTIFSENFEGTSEGVITTGGFNGWKVYEITDNGANEWSITDNACAISGTYSMSIQDAGTYCSYDNGSSDERIAYYGTLINATNFTSLTIDFNWTCDGESSFDRGRLAYSSDGTSWTNFYTTNYSEQTSTQSVTNLDISAKDGEQFYIGFRWRNDGSLGGDPGWTVDDIVIKGIAGCMPPVATFPVNTTNCGAGNFQIDVTVTDMGDADNIIITDNQGNTFNNGGAGYVLGDFPVTIGTYAAGTNVIVTVDDDNVSCPLVSSTITEACSCNNLPTATAVATNLDCGANTFQIEINLSNLGDGTGVNITDGAVTAGLTNVGIGTHLLGPYSTVANITITLDAGPYSSSFSCQTDIGPITAGCNPDNCADAVSLTVNGSSWYQDGSILSTSTTSDVSCDNNYDGCDDDCFGNAWFTFVANGADDITISITDPGTPATWYSSEVLTLFSGTCGALTQEGACDDETTADTYVFNGLTAGTTYYIEISSTFNSDINDRLEFDIAVTSSCVKPTATYTKVNNCNGGQFSIDVNVSSFGLATAVDLNYGTSSLTNITTTGIQTIGPFTAGESITVTVDGTNYGGCAADPSTAITENCVCTNMPTATITEVNKDCAAGTFDIQVDITSIGDGTGVDIIINGTTVGTNLANSATATYAGYPEGTTATVVIDARPYAPYISCETSYSSVAHCLNDLCSDAQFRVITVDGAPVASSDYSLLAYSGTMPSCGTPTDDSWYQFVAPASGIVQITETANTTAQSDMGYAVYSGSCGGTEVACETSGLNGAAISELTAGGTYFLQVWSTSNIVAGAVTLVMENPVQTLDLGIETCTATTDEANYSDFNPTAQCGCTNCGDNATDVEVIYTYTPTTTGSYTINATGSTDNDVAIVLVANPLTTSSACQAFDQQSTGGVVNLILTENLTAGAIYFIIVSHRFAPVAGNEICLKVDATCTGLTIDAPVITDNCAGESFQADISLSAIGSLDHYDIISESTTYSNVAISTTYSFNYNDLASHIIRIDGFDAANNKICSDDLTVNSTCIPDDCANAIDIFKKQVSGDLNTATIATTYLHNSINIANGTTFRDCNQGGHSAHFHTDYKDLWYVVQIPVGADEFTVTIEGNTCDLAILPYTSDCNTLTLLDISGSSLSGTDNIVGGQPTFFPPDAGNGKSFRFFGGTAPDDVVTYSANPIYIRVVAHDDSADNSGPPWCDNITHCDFTIFATAPQANDVCADAIDIDGITKADELCKANIDSENTETGATCSAGGATNDLWYEVTMDVGDNDQLLQLDLTFPNATDAVVVELHHGCFSGSFEECALVSSTGANSTITHEFSTTITAGGFGPTWYVRVIPQDGNTICNYSILGRRVAKNNDCTIANETFPLAFTATNAVAADFQYATASGAASIAGSDLWYVFDPTFGVDANGIPVYSTAATINITGLGASETLDLILYKRHGSTGANCTDFAGDVLSTTSVTADGTFTLSCLDEIHGTSATGDGYILRMVQTGGGSSTSLTAQVTPGPVGSFNNSCVNIWNGTGPTTLSGPDAAHDFNYFKILNGETTNGNFTGSTDCDSEITSTDCNGNSNDVSQRDLWYIFEVPTTICGTNLSDLVTSTVIENMEITYAANPPDAFKDAKVWVYSDCADASLLSGGNIGTTGCTTAGLDGAGDAHTVTGLTQGQDYLIRIKPSDLNSTLDYSFNIGVNNGPVSPCNDYKANAYSLTVNDCLDYPNLLTLSAKGANDEENFGENDVFFKFTAPSPANGGSYFNADKSWVSVFLESVSGQNIIMELWKSGAVVATAQAFSVSGTNDKIWGRFGHLTPGQEYQIRLRHNQIITQEVQYKIAVEGGNGNTVSTCDPVDITTSPVLCGSCGGGDPFVYNPSIANNDHCEMWYKIDLPVGAGGAGTFWIAEVRGYEQVLDFELRSQYISESSANEGDEDDFDHPCSSRPLEPAASLVSTQEVTYSVAAGPTYSSIMLNAMGSSTCDCTTGCTTSENASQGGGYRKVYSNLNGPAAGQKDYYFLRVFMDPDDPNYASCKDGSLMINPCQIIFRGPYSSDPTANIPAPGAPDLVCGVACPADATAPTGTNMTLCAAGGALTSTDAVTDAGQTDYTVLYLLVNSTNVIVDNAATPAALSAPANTQSTCPVTNEIYTIYTLEYETAQGISITNNTTTLTTIEDADGDIIQATPITTACIDLSSAGLTITVQAPIIIVPSSTTTCNGFTDFSTTFTICGGSGIYATVTASSGTLSATSGTNATTFTVSGIINNTVVAITVTDDSSPVCTGGSTNLITTDCSPPCVVDPGTIPLDPLGCQEVADEVTGMTSIDMLSYDFNNMVTYTQAYFITDGTNVLEVKEVVGTGVTPVTVTSNLSTYTAGTYDIYVINYANTDGGANAATIAGLTTVAAITAIPTSYTTGACMVRTANAMTVEVCAASCVCDDGTNSGGLQAQTAVPGSYNSVFGQTYLLTNTDADPLILAIQDNANFTGLAAGDYKVYALNYSTTAGESPLLNNGAFWTAITPNTTTIGHLSITPGLADACFALSAPTGNLSVITCLTNLASLSNNGPHCSGSTSTLTVTLSTAQSQDIIVTIDNGIGNVTVSANATTATATTAALTGDITYNITGIAYSTVPTCPTTSASASTVTINPVPDISITDPGNQCDSYDVSMLMVTDANSVDGTLTTYHSASPANATDMTNQLPSNTITSSQTVFVMVANPTTGCFDVASIVLTIVMNSSATVTTTVDVCNVATEIGNDDGQADLDALVTAGDLTGTWTIFSGNTGGSATITGTMAGSDVVFDAGTETGPLTLRYTLTGTVSCTDVTYDVTVTRVECAACAPKAGVVRSN